MHSVNIPEEFLRNDGKKNQVPDIDFIANSNVYLLVNTSIALLNHEVSLTDDALDTIQGHIKQLNIQRATNVSNCIAERARCRSLLQELYSTTSSSELKEHLLCLTLGDDIMESTSITAVELVSDANTNPPPGSGLLLMALERLRLGLETVRMNRVTMLGLLDEFTAAVYNAEVFIR